MMGVVGQSWDQSEQPPSPVCVQWKKRGFPAAHDRLVSHNTDGQKRRTTTTLRPWEEVSLHVLHDSPSKQFPAFLGSHYQSPLVFASLGKDGAFSHYISNSLPLHWSS